MKTILAACLLLTFLSVAVLAVPEQGVGRENADQYTPAATVEPQRKNVTNAQQRNAELREQAEARAAELAKLRAVKKAQREAARQAQRAASEVAPEATTEATTEAARPAAGETAGETPRAGANTAASVAPSATPAPATPAYAPGAEKDVTAAGQKKGPEKGQAPYREPRKEQNTARGEYKASSGGVSMQDTVRRALDYSPQVQQAQESREQASHEVRRAEAGYYPTIGVWAGVGATQSDDTTTRATNEQTKTVGTGTTGAKFSQSVWQGGSTSALVRSRAASLEAQAYMVTDSATLIAFNAISSHTDVIRRRLLLQLSQKNVEEHKRILHLLRARYEQGIASQGEVDQVQGRLSRAEATELGHKMGLQAALANYGRLTGRPVPSELRDTAMPTTVYTRMDEVRDDSVQYNPRLQAELANIKSALGEQDYVRGNFSPRVSVDGGPAYTDWGRKGDNHQWTWNAMLNVNWDLFSGGADVAAYRSAAAKTRQLRKALHVYMDLLDEEIRVTWSRCFELRDQSRHYTRAKEASRRARDNFFEQFLAGQRGLLDVLDAESEYFYASVEECIAATDSVLGFYRLLALSGRLLPELGMNVPAAPKATEPQGAAWNFLDGPSTLDRGEALKGSTLRDVSTGQ